LLGEKKSDLDKEVKRGLLSIGINEDYDDSFKHKFISRKNFGICYDCRSLMAYQTQYGRSYGKCFQFDKEMNGNDPVVKCTYYDKKGMLSLDDMKEIAIIIEVDKRKVGFGSSED